MATAPTVYLVDDDDAVRAALGVLLDVEGFAVHGYGSAQALLNDLSGTEGEAVGGCVVTDVHMTGMSGLELVGRLRAKGLTLPVLVITGRADATLGAQAMAAGATRLIAKPFSPDEIVGAIQAALAA